MEGTPHVQKTVLLGTARILARTEKLLVVAQFQKYFPV